MTLPRFLTRSALIGSFSFFAGAFALVAPDVASADTDDGFRGRGHRGEVRHRGGGHHGYVAKKYHHGKRGHYRHKGRHHGHHRDVVVYEAPPVHCEPPVVYAPPPRVHYVPPPPPRYIPQREVVYVEPQPVYVAPPAGVRLTVDPSGASLDINLPLF